jgi:uroporphyrinogen decarboxylase
MNSGVTISKRERFKVICRGERPSDVSIMDWFHRGWPETTEAWIAQGAPVEIRNQDSLNQYFQFEHLHGLCEVISEHNRNDLKENPFALAIGSYSNLPPILPVFERKILSEDARHRIETTYGGSVIEVAKEFPQRMPRYLDRPVKDWATWSEYKKRLDPHTPERWPMDWNAFVEERNSQDNPTMLLLEGLFMCAREFMGLEDLLFTFYDDPKLIEDMMEQVLYLELEVVRRATKELKIEIARISEDIGYKSGSLISPAMVQKYMIPRYQQIVDLLHSNGVQIVQMDSDGNVSELIPLWLEIGINFVWPLEVAAGMDAIDLRHKYGKDLILGGNIDKRVFSKGEKAIYEEVKSKVPFLLQTGGYFPCLDHIVPPDLSLASFRYYINLLREIGGMDKLPE